MTSAKFLASASMLVLLSACAVQPKPFTAEEMRTRMEDDKAAIFRAEPLSRPLTLSDAIARALRHNLDHRTRVMEQALALGLTKVDRWDMLPRLAANAGYTGRSEPYATRSRNLRTQGTSADADPTYSADRDAITADLTLSWNILDFGVSYFNAQQNADRVLIAEERRRKTVHNLVQEVRTTFWRAAAAQVLQDEVRRTVELGEQALADSRRVEAANLRNPAETLRFQKGLLETLRQLEGVSQDLSTARIELAALIDLPPGTEFTLAVPSDSEMILPTLTMPVEQMEEIALLNNADLREQGYNARIAADETRKTILKLLPGISFGAGRNYDQNSFLADNNWYEASAKLSWNLVNLLSAPDRIEAAEAVESVAQARRQALSMAVMAQVHVGVRQFANAVRQCQRADELYKVERRLAEYIRVRAENDAQSTLEQIANQSSAIAASLRRYQAYAQVHAALGRLQATLGQDLLPGPVASHDVETLSRQVALGLEAWSRGLPSVSVQAETPPSADALGVGGLFSQVEAWFAPAAPRLAAETGR